MITFQEEILRNCLDEYKNLAECHWNETVKPTTNDKFDPNWDKYVEYNDIGFFHFYTARKDGKMVGNMGIYVTSSMHTRKVVATEDSWFMLPEIRSGRNAKNFVEFVHRELKKLGVTSGRTTTPPCAGSRRLLEYLGYRHVADCLQKEF